MDYDLIVIGGGASGFFGAIQAAEINPGLRIIILEKSNKVLAKVKISGGGRCNVTHRCYNPFQLARHYPRGERALKQMFKSFQASDMVHWLSAKGVDLKAEDDGRMFPTSDESQTIIDLFLSEASKRQIKLELGTGVDRIAPSQNDLLTVHCSNNQTYSARKILVAVGGNPKAEFYSWLTELGHSVVEPIPSLFTFNDTKKEFVDLMGVAVTSAEVKISGTKLSERGSVMITHWGLSGPAVIKLSAWAATYLHAKHYRFTALVNWTMFEKEDELRTILIQQREKKPKQKTLSNPLFSLPARLWERLCMMSEIDKDKIWGEVPNRCINKLLENLFRCPFQIEGKTTFKEEFVTCGGIDLKEIDLETMESTKMKNVYFAGEVLNIDGETGGFNFQAAWTTAYLAAKSIVKSC